jgi:hypothetical protein
MTSPVIAELTDEVAAALAPHPSGGGDAYRACAIVPA